MDYEWNEVCNKMSAMVDLGNIAHPNSLHGNNYVLAIGTVVGWKIIHGLQGCVNTFELLSSITLCLVRYYSCKGRVW